MVKVPPEYVALGQRVREVRRRLSATQAYLAEQLDVTVSFISQIENGKTKVSDHRIQLLERALELPHGSLFREVNKVPFDLARTLLMEADGMRATDPLQDLTPAEREELIRYLTFLRIQQTLPRLA